MTRAVENKIYAQNLETLCNEENRTEKQNTLCSSYNSFCYTITPTSIDILN